MTKVTLNPMFERLQGKFGNIVFRLAHSGTLTMTKVPDMSRVKWSEAQVEHRQRFKQAVAYARLAMADPDIRAKYEEAAAIKGKRPFDLAVSDFFHGINLLEKS